MTTYYFKSQLTETLGTDEHLSEQIKITPQAEYSTTSDGYFQTAASWSGVTDTPPYNLPNSVYVGPEGLRYKFITVKNTGTNPFLLVGSERLSTFSDQSITVQDVFSCSGSSAYTGSEKLIQGTSSIDSALAPVGRLSKFTPRWVTVLESDNSSKVTRASSSQSNFTVSDSDASSWGSTISGEFYVPLPSFVKPGQTVTVSANAQMQIEDFSLPSINKPGRYPFYITYDPRNASESDPSSFLPWNASIFGMEE